MRASTTQLLPITTRSSPWQLLPLSFGSAQSTKSSATALHRRPLEDEDPFP